MTPNELKILECLSLAQGRARFKLIAQASNFSSHYVKDLCCSLERNGYLKFISPNVCCLLAKGCNRMRPGKKIVKAKNLSKVAVRSSLDGLNASLEEKEKLMQAGYCSIEDVAKAAIAKFVQEVEVELKRAAHWINRARRQTGVIRDKSIV